MIKRPLNSRFSDKALAGTKITTIRDNSWPFGVPIMLYNWSGAAYRSKQIDVCAVEVVMASPITISNTPDGMRYSVGSVGGVILWKTEGFDSGEELDAWFSAIIPPGRSVTKHLMRFRKLS